MYPAALTATTLAVSAAFATVAAVSGSAHALDQVSALIVVAAGVTGYAGFRFCVALRRGRVSTDAEVRRVRQQYRLTSRSWIEIRDRHGTRWVPVYFDPVLLRMPTPTTATVAGAAVTWEGSRLYPSGPVRRRDPIGKLLDNPSRVSADATERAATASRPVRRLTLDASQAIAGPLVGLLWVYVDGGGIAAFVGATCVAAVVAIWLAAIRGSDPS